MDEFDFRSEEINFIIFSAIKGLWAPGWTIDDLINEARVGVWEASLSWKPEKGRWKSFAIMCARRKAMDLVTRSNTQKSRCLRSFVQLEVTNAYNIEDTSFRYSDGKQRFYRLLEQIELTELEKEVLNLRLLDYSYTEIAKQLDITYKMVDNANQRIIRKLRQKL